MSWKCMRTARSREIWSSFWIARASTRTMTSTTRCTSRTRALRRGERGCSSSDQNDSRSTMSEATSIRSTVAAYYASKLATFGPTPQGVDWNGAGSHELRHRQFLRLIGGDREASVLDLGCGFGDFLRFLRAEGHQGPFIGYDVAPDMIAEAIRQHANTANCQWQVGAEPTETTDFAIASGILN